MKVIIEKGKKGDFIGSPFCLIDRKYHDIINEGEEWEVEVVRTIKDKRGKDINIVKPVKKVYHIKEEDGVYCGRNVCKVKYYVNDKLVGEVEEYNYAEEIIKRGVNWLREIFMIKEKIKKYREYRKRKEEEERIKHLKETIKERVQKRVEEIKQELNKHINEQIVYIDTKALEDDMKRLKEEKEQIEEELKFLDKAERIAIPEEYKDKEVIHLTKDVYIQYWGREKKPYYRYDIYTFPDGRKYVQKYTYYVEHGYRDDGDHFVGLGGEWIDGEEGWSPTGFLKEFNEEIEKELKDYKYIETEEVYVVSNMKEKYDKLYKRLTKINKENLYNKGLEALQKFLKENPNPIIVEKEEKEETYIIVYPTVGRGGISAEAEVVFPNKEEIESINDILEFAEGIDDTAYPKTIRKAFKLIDRFKV